ncbi:nickel pincer cofactor biosynthesis protein LarB [Staphylococcus xylosus]|uniref:Nickel pincer cofactor biosynthesis protein LarB n=1 Tax=Staphylococcus xylosus TaxID=1288 RepID=A0AAQ0LWW3_STAXY|nr:nickel pincer cofactor biosynthesis protein LarB [Staphylococcus xylosus]MCA2499208.1 nickel pincer cofactor biosynthesis protein LarB [Staphylococcus xylosus]MCA2503451.1 nickel pincer cofactor biosynthesis protein LarB [Staphylococcus xylosus]MCE7781556.1 nickel pincer cofactor biosynthesis protein LarB [Staphylococcus xylosus]MCM3519681.1 nickel pincer cofactor biosynthesis protein LarB [Staphylococcus xylosus]MEB6290288.1 nickel pincer cofactor biosynthesis protein LarB [Staphylococcus 
MTDKQDSLDSLLQAVQSNQLSVTEAKTQLSHYDELGFAKIDLHRRQRQGFPEVVFGEGKTTSQIIDIISTLLAHDEIVLVTRVDYNKAQDIIAKYSHLEYHEAARIICTPISNISKSNYYTSVICAGTSDLPVAEEAAITAEVMGIHVKRFYDVGVSGIHRLFSHIEAIRQSKVSIVVAGMEGALSSVVSGLVDHPVYSVPTSIGYGANLEGVTTLLSMVNSCAPGTSVLNIDNGFGGGYNAAMIIKMIEAH